MVDGEFNGQGTLTFANGDTHTGQFAKGQLDGQGSITVANPVPNSRGLTTFGAQGVFNEGNLNDGVLKIAVNGMPLEVPIKNGVPVSSANTAMPVPSEAAKFNALYNSQMRDVYHQKSIDTTKEYYQTLRSGAIRSGD